METLSKNKMDYIFDDYFENMDLNSDIKKIYEIINDVDLQEEFDKQSILTKLRNNNHKRYYDININKFIGLPEEFDDIVDDINKVYSFIDFKNLLIEDYDSAQNTQKLLDNVYRKINRLNQMIKTSLKELYKYNDDKQSIFSRVYLDNLNLDQNLKRKLIDKYESLVLFSSFVSNDIYEDIKRQSLRRKYIKALLSLINLEQENKTNLEKRDKIKELNKKIDIEIAKYTQKMYYLEDLMPENSKYTQEFTDFKVFYNKIIAYNDENYNITKQTYEVLSNDLRLKIMFSSFEKMFIEEREDIEKEEKFVYEKFGIKNIKKSLNYIKANYIDKLDETSKITIEEIYNKIDSNNYNLEELEKKLSLIVKNIWVKTITDVYSYNPNEDFYFICSNNQFIDEKYKTILITKKELDRVDDYSDYQIGFICGYDDNILYITENEDIMTVDYDDMSSLKTPLQLEQEFINFRVCNRIALNGYKTKIQAVYYIKNANKEIYKKAVELANMYKLPLIELKK